MFRVFRVFRGSYLIQQLFGEAGWVTFRTETQRGTENTEELFLAVVGLIYLSTALCLSRLRTEQRAKRGTASQFPEQRGYEKPRNTHDLFSVEKAVKQPVLYPLFPPRRMMRYRS